MKSAWSKAIGGSWSTANQRVSWGRRIEAAGDETEVSCCQLPLARVAVGAAQRLELLQVGDLANVHLHRQMAADRFLERLAGLEVPAGEGPGAAVGLLRSLPQEHQRAPRTWRMTASVTCVAEGRADVFASGFETLVD